MMMNDLASIEARILEFIRSRALRSGDREITAETYLGGILTSNVIIALLAFIENELGAEVPIEAFLAKKFDDVASIARFVEQHGRGET
jgi:acyl carrier protein